MPRTPWTTPLTTAETERWEAVATEVGQLLARDALARDRANQQPDAELKLLKDTGLADLLIPKEFGGHGGHWSTGLRAVRILARYDASIAQILSYHYGNQAGIVFFGAADRWEHWFTASAADSWLWGTRSTPPTPTWYSHPTVTGTGSTDASDSRRARPVATSR